jgi:hypothetical protein
MLEIGSVVVISKLFRCTVAPIETRPEGSDLQRSGLGSWMPWIPFGDHPSSTNDTTENRMAPVQHELKASLIFVWHPVKCLTTSFRGRGTRPLRSVAKVPVAVLVHPVADDTSLSAQARLGVHHVAPDQWVQWTY